MKKIIKTRYQIFIVILFIGSFSSCKKFLAEPPSKTTSLVVQTTVQLDALLSRYQVFYQEKNSFIQFSTDDYGLTKTIYDARPTLFSASSMQYMLWDTQFLSFVADPVWAPEFQKIFTANLVLDYVDKVTGTEAEKAVLKADAHFVRAYSYWVLANTYCLPYTEANKNEPGLPIKRSTSFEEPFARQSLSKVYDFIEADLAEALKTTVPLIQNGRPRHWRASKAGVNGFAARYYLNRLNYSKAIEHANAALGEYSRLVDYNTEMRYGIPTTVTLNSATPQQQSYTVQFPYTHDNQIDLTDWFGWKEFLYFRTMYMGVNWYMPSQDLLNLYDQAHDLRFKYHMVQGYSYVKGLIKPSYDYPGYVFFYIYDLPTGPTVAEMYLTKAEALARTGDISGAMTALNTLRAKRMKPGAWVNLTATNKEDAIKKVIDERRREMPFTQRWYDLRRYNNNEDPNDDVNLSRVFYPYSNSAVLATEPLKTYTLPKNSRRWAAPIPNTEIISSNYEIQQNTY